MMDSMELIVTVPKCVLVLLMAKTKYVDATDTIQFVHKHEDGTVTPGWQSEQLALILLDRVKKLNEKFPCEQKC
jgi:hypothetical protein